MKELGKIPHIEECHEEPDIKCKLIVRNADYEGAHKPGDVAEGT